MKKYRTKSNDRINWLICAADEHIKDRNYCFCEPKHTCSTCLIIEAILHYWQTYRPPVLFHEFEEIGAKK
jgi:hypothetical protein